MDLKVTKKSKSDHLSNNCDAQYDFDLVDAKSRFLVGLEDRGAGAPSITP